MLLENRLQEAQIAQAVEDSRVRIVDPSIRAAKPIKPNRTQYIGFGLLIGLIVGVGMALLRESIDRAIHTREEMTQLTGVASLGLIPHIESEHRLGETARRARRRKANGIEGNILTIRSPRNPATEAYRTLRTNITFARADAPIKTLVFTSPTPGDGKSTTASNLATTLAHQGLRVVLVDGDMRRGTLHDVFGIQRSPGLSSVLIGTAQFADCVQTVSLGDLGSIGILPAGVFPPNPSELFASRALSQLIAELETKYDIVIFDSPPVNLVTDAAILGAKAGGVILIGRAGKTDKGAIAYAAEQLRNVRAPILGTVLNDFDFRRDIRYSSYGTPGYYYYSSYGYGYGYGSGEGYGVAAKDVPRTAGRMSTSSRDKART